MVGVWWLVFGVLCFVLIERCLCCCLLFGVCCIFCVVCCCVSGYGRCLLFVVGGVFVMFSSL